MVYNVVFKKISVLKSSLLNAIIGFIFGLIYGLLFYFTTSTITTSLPSTLSSSTNFMNQLGVAMIFVMPLIFALLYFIFTAIAVFIFNLFLALIKGIPMQIEEISENSHNKQSETTIKKLPSKNNPTSNTSKINNNPTNQTTPPRAPPLSIQPATLPNFNY